MADGEEAPMATPPLIHDAEAQVFGDPAECCGPQACPGERLTPVAVGVFEPRDAELLDVMVVTLDEQLSRRADELRTAAQQGLRLAADADVPVGEQEGLPTPFGRQRIEYRPAQRDSAQGDGP